MTEEKYKSCLDYNYKFVSWLNKMNHNVDNPNDLIFSITTHNAYKPRCRLDCLYAKRCEEMWR